MKAKGMTKVYVVDTDLLAAAIQDTLEKSGIPVSVQHTREGHEFRVSSERASEAQELLSPSPKSGEIYFVPSQPIKLSFPQF